MKHLLLMASLVATPMIDGEGRHSSWDDFQCDSPLYCEEMTGTLMPWEFSFDVYVSWQGEQKRIYDDK